MPRRRSSRRPRRRAWSRPIQLETLEPRRLLAAGGLPTGITPLNTGEFLLGTVGVVPVFFESNGGFDTETQDWEPQEILETLAKIDEGVDWWSRALDKISSVHTLDFVINDEFAKTPVETGYEPIDRSSEIFQEYVGTFLTDQGYGDAPSIERAVQLFNHDQRIAMGTDWAFTIFVVDSSDDPDGLFSSGGNFSGAFAFPGGLFIMTPSTRPASTIAHEMGHIFWARDEYPGASSYTDRRGYYNSQVLNAADNPDPNSVHEISIMRGGVPLSEAYLAETSPESTFALVGWRDSDQDGVFDVLDVPLNLDAIGYFDPVASEYHIAGTASAIPLKNENSSGVQSDITLNRISELQYRVDSGLWITAADPNQQSVDFDLAVPLLHGFSTIDWRAIDTTVGITSQIITGTSTIPSVSAASINGFAFVDGNDDGQRDSTESLMGNTQIVVRQSNGSELFGGQFAATDFASGDIAVPTPGVQLSGDGSLIRNQLASLDSADAGKRVFQSFHTQTDTYRDRWSASNIFVAEFDQNVGEVEVSVTGLDDGGYARLEAYNSSGQLIKRVTSEEIPDGEVRSVTIADPSSRIAKIRAFGHAETSIAIDDIRFGYIASVVTDASGAWKIANLPDGQYRVDLVANRLIHQFIDASPQITVTNGSSQSIVAAAQRVDSPRYNVAIPEDVSGEGKISSRDALLVINDMTAQGPRVLGPNETNGDWIDVNNDGAVSGLDALLVINKLAELKDAEPELVELSPSAAKRAASASDVVLANWGRTPHLVSNPSMFNSNGQSADDERTAPFLTDKDIDTAPAGTSDFMISAAGFIDFAENAVENANPGENHGEMTALLNDTINPEISEPLA